MNKMWPEIPCWHKSTQRCLVFFGGKPQNGIYKQNKSIIYVVVLLFLPLLTDHHYINVSWNNFIVTDTQHTHTLVWHGQVGWLAWFSFDQSNLFGCMNFHETVLWFSERVCVRACLWPVVTVYVSFCVGLKMCDKHISLGSFTAYISEIVCTHRCFFFFLLVHIIITSHK